VNRGTKLRQARNSYAVVWYQFINGFAKNPERLFCFFEGYDAKYYGVRIDTIVCDSDRVNLNCNGRDGVISLFEIISKDERYKNGWLAFFIDRDYSAVSSLPSSWNVYVTPCYSIENLYVSCAAFKRILADEFQIPVLDPKSTDFSSIAQLYEMRLKEFNDATQELNAWIFLNRLAERADADKAKLYLNNINMNTLVDVTLDKIQQKYTIQTLPEIFKDGLTFSEAELQAQTDKFSQVDKTNVFRGKYLVEFLRLFLVQLKTDRTSSTPAYFSQKGNAKLNLSRTNLISELCQYADTPDCLRKFLAQLLLFRPENAHN
jgi:hypothetical protein